MAVRICFSIWISSIIAPSAWSLLRRMILKDGPFHQLVNWICESNFVNRRHMMNCCLGPIMMIQIFTQTFTPTFSVRLEFKSLHADKQKLFDRLQLFCIVLQEKSSFKGRPPVIWMVAITFKMFHYFQSFRTFNARLIFPPASGPMARRKDRPRKSGQFGWFFILLLN